MVSARPDFAFQHEIVERLFLGSWKAAYDQPLLEELKINHILSLGKEPSFLPVSKFKRMFIDIPDRDNEDLGQHFEKAVEFIDNAIESGGTILVHCIAGVSRSASCVIAYLMKKRGMSLDEALAHTKSRRPAV